MKLKSCHWRAFILAPMVILFAFGLPNPVMAWVQGILGVLWLLVAILDALWP